MQLQAAIESYLSDRQQGALRELEELISDLRNQVPGPAYGILEAALNRCVDAKAWDIVRILAMHGICTSSAFSFTRRLLEEQQFELLRLAFTSPNSVDFDSIVENAVEANDPKLLTSFLDCVGDQIASAPIRRAVELALSKQSFDCFAAIANHKEVLFSSSELEHFMALTQSIEDARFPLLLVAVGAPTQSLPRMWRLRLGMQR